MNAGDERNFRGGPTNFEAGRSLARVAPGCTGNFCNWRIQIELGIGNSPLKTAAIFPRLNKGGRVSFFLLAERAPYKFHLNELYRHCLSD
jgi:hypothetical protein